MRQVAQVMGMPITIDIPNARSAGVFETAFERLRQIDERFSTYIKDSEVSRYGRGEIEKPGKELAAVILACKKAQKETDGYFDVWAAGKFDPSGYVKGWAIAEAGKIIDKAGHRTFCISAGGDILAASEGEKVWNIGIQDPFDPSKILNKLSIGNGAVATSGNYIRGEHIINPKTKRPASYWASVTVSGPDIITADILATACFAMGQKAPKFMSKCRDYKFLAIKGA